MCVWCVCVCGVCLCVCGVVVCGCVWLCGVCGVVCVCVCVLCVCVCVCPELHLCYRNTLRSLLCLSTEVGYFLMLGKDWNGVCGCLA